MNRHLQLYLIFFLCGLVYLSAQNPTAKPLNAALSMEDIDAKIQSILKNAPSGDNTDQLLSTLEATKQSMERRQLSAEATKKYESIVQRSPQELEEITKKLNTPATEEPIPATQDLDLETVKRTFSEITTELAVTKVKLSTHAAESKTRSQRRDEIPLRIGELKAKQLELNVQNQPQSAAQEIEKAKYSLHLATQEELIGKISELETELLAINASSELFSSQKVFFTREISRLEKTLAQWQKTLTKKESEITTATQNAADDSLKRFKNIPILAKTAEETAKQAQLRIHLADKVAAAKRYEEKITTQYRQTIENRTNAQERIKLLESAGLPIDVQTGSLLRIQRSKLPTIKTLTTELEENIKASTTAQLEKLALADKIEALPIDLDAQITDILTQTTDKSIREAEIRELYEQQKKILHLNHKEYSNYITILKSTNESAKQVIQEVETYSLYLDERLLWIASAPPISRADIPTELSTIKDIFSSQNWQKWFYHLSADVAEHSIIWILTFLLLIHLIYRRRRFRKVLKICGEEAAKRNCLSILPTLQGIWVSFLLVLPLTLFFGFLAWRTHSFVEISNAFRNCAFFLGTVGFLRTLAKPHGILSAHLDIEKERSAHLLKCLRWLPLLILPLLFLTTILLTNQDPPQSGRLIFILMLTAVGYMNHLILRPSKGLIGNAKQSRKLAKFYYVLAIGIPLFFIIGSCLGYVSSVQTLRLQTVGSVWIILLAVFLSKLLIRWILISRRRLAKDQATKKHKAVLAARQQAKKGEVPKEATSLEEIEAHALDVVSVEEQTTRLLKVGMTVCIAFGLWSIWSTSLPALSILDNIPVWQSSESENTPDNSLSNISDTLTATSTMQEATGTENQPNSAIAKEESISLQDLIGSIIIIALTLIGARNLPGLLELSLLRRLDLQPGGNYAVTTVVRYLIIAVGLLLAFGKIGITWSSVQWLAAAITLGIGFGLQEIFANFVAGIIILFERPIRLGDVVTVGEVSGKVTQIKIRATTIKQFNNRELVVPNKEFITGQLVNWTLNDSILRFDLPVGIAYGSDTAQATQILFEILSKHPDVLKEPKTDVLFTAFGSSSLDFIVRGHVNSVENLVSTQSSLHYEIDKRFREAGIEIAFPQTDIHIRSFPDNTNEELPLTTPNPPAKPLNQ